MFKQRVVQVHRKIVKNDDQIMSIVPLWFGADTHVVVMLAGSIEVLLSIINRDCKRYW